MSITVASNFAVSTTLPLDARTQVADQTARDAILAGVRYEGLIVYSIADGTNYQLVGGIANGDWVELAGAGGGGTAITPTIQKFLSGTGTYTTSSNVSYIRVKAVGGGGGGAGSGVTGTTGGNGGNTTFGSSLISCVGGVGATAVSGGAGGSATATGLIGTILSGGSGSGAGTPGAATVEYLNGCEGAASALGGAGGGGPGGTAGTSAATNSGSGGGGAGFVPGIAGQLGGGGGAGGYVDVIITAPAATYSYDVGVSGSGGTAGTSGYAGGDGGSGYIEVTEFYNNSASVGTANPVGCMVEYAGATAPTGWLIADGASLLRAGTYASLFSVIGTVFGAVDGTHFNIPDRRGIFGRGVGSQTIGPVTYTGVLGQVEGDQFQGHYHAASASANALHDSTGKSPDVSSGLPLGVTGVTVTVTAPTDDGTNGTVRYGTETRPANIGVNFIIKY